MIKYTCLFFVAATLACFTVNGQKAAMYWVKGTIADSASGSGLENANILLRSATAPAAEKQFYTGKNGSFRIPLPAGEYHISVTYAGYYQADLTTNIQTDTALLPLFLRPATGNLKTVTVESRKPFITLSPGKINLNVAESIIAAGNTAWDVLQIAPGVIATEDGRLTLNGRPVTVYVDGRPSYLSGEQLKNLLTTMQGTAVEKIELISTPSAKYDAAGQAVINIRTKKITKKGFNGTWTTGAGASRYFKYNSGADLNYFRNKTNIFANIDFSHNANNYRPVSSRTSNTGTGILFITESEDEIRRRSNYSFRGGIDYSPSKNTTIGLLLKAYNNQRTRQVSGLTLMGGQKTIADSSISAITGGNAVFSSPAINFFLRTSADSARKELTINADYYRYSQQWNDLFTISFRDHSGQNYKNPEYRRDNSPTTLAIYAVTADYAVQGKKISSEAGLKSSWINTDNDVRWENNSGSGWQNDTLRTNHFMYKENINAIYGSLNFLLFKWKTEAALRMEQTSTEGYSATLNTRFSRHYLGWFPSLSVAKSLNKKNEITVSYRKSISRPYYSYTNPFLIYQGQFNYFQGNPDMKPSYTHAITLVHSYRNFLYTTLAYNYTKDLIAVFYRQNDSTKIITRYYDNYKSASSWSLTVAFAKYVKPWWMTSTSFDLSYETAVSGEVAASGSSTIVPYVNTYNNFLLKKHGIKIEVSGSYRPGYSDGFYRYRPNGGLNLGVQKDILQKKGLLKLGVRDVFRSYVLRYTAQYGNVDISTSPYSDSRSIQLNFIYRFGKQFAMKNKNRRSSIDTETNRIN